MSKQETDEQMVKILFKLEQDEDGYPPAEWESLWAKKLGSNRFLIENIPFFVRGLSYGDVIQANIIDDEYHFSRVFEYGGQSTIRVVPFDSCDLEEFQVKLKRLGCDIEYIKDYNLVAINMPDITILKRARAFLLEEKARERIVFEESAVYD